MTGGYDATSAWLASAELYTPAGDGPQAGTFVATGNLTTARDGQTATPLPNGLVLLAGDRPEPVPWRVRSFTTRRRARSLLRVT